MNYLINGFAALAFLFLFSQCAGKADNAAAPAASGNANATSGLKIAYVGEQPHGAESESK